MEHIENFLVSVGVVTTTYFLVSTLYKLYNIWKLYIFPKYPDFSKYGEWSVVTGATDGIGKALSFQLAAHGQNVVLIARNEEKLKRVANEIESKYAVEIRYLQIDFTRDQSIYNKIEEFLSSLDVGVLVNNVGIGEIAWDFLETPNLSQHLLDITKVNVFSLYKMHQIILPKMVKKKKGLIVNLSSASAIRPTIYFAVYGATKSFTDYFSQSLALEFAEKGITIQSCMPFYISTNLTKNPKTSLFVKTPQSFASSTLATVEREQVTHGCWQHALQGWFTRHLPTQWFCYIMKSVLSEERRQMRRKRL